MVWPFHRTVSDSDKETALLSQLSPQSQAFYSLESRKFNSTTTRTDPMAAEQSATSPEFDQYTSLHPPKETRYVNCSEIQSAFMQCIQSGPWTERWSGCETLSKRVQSCLKFQTLVLEKLRFEDAKTIETYKRISGAADSLCGVWLDRFVEMGKLDDVILKDVFDKRDGIWGKK